MSQRKAVLSPMPLSEEQAKAVWARGSDVAVTAGAGTGKTRTLVARYLSLLASGLSPRQVVAVTFTRKAAREMRNRVRAQVGGYLEGSVLASAERARWEKAYASLDAARIGTIHSLCAEILRHHPAEAAVDPAFEMLNEGQAALLRSQAVDEALAWAADDEQAARLFTDLGERTLRSVLASLLERCLDVGSARRDLPLDLWGQVWLPRLVSFMGAFVDDQRVRHCFAHLSALRDEGLLARAQAAGDALAPLIADALARWETILAAQADHDWVRVGTELGPLREALKQKGRKSNWAPADPKSVVKDLQALFDESLGGLVVTSGTVHCLDLELDRRLATQVLPQLLRAYDLAVDRYDRAKGERTALDFDDLERGALQLLRERPAVLAHWQREVRALLVDEFQDTNARQRDLIDLISDGVGKLFVVGDGKQSIYRFRGADVTVFRQKRQEIGLRGQTFDLATSYRAHRGLIEGLNALLRPVLGEQDPLRPYVEPFASLVPSREAPAHGLGPPFIELHLALGTKGEGAPQRAARALVSRLRELVEGGEVQIVETEEPGRKGPRDLNYGDIAILCRASSSFAAYEDALDAAGVPFTTVAGRGFYDRPEVRDVLNALCALSDPTDDLALAGLLRSPACGLSDMALYRLAESRRDQGRPSLWAVLCQGDLAVLEDEAHLAERCRDLVRGLHTLVGRATVADVLKAYLDRTDYPAALLRAGQMRGALNVGKLLSDAQASDLVGVGAFLEYVAELRDAGTREGEAHTVSTGAVQVMSVHAAKGLEFPVVVIGDAGHRTPSGHGVIVDPGLGVLLPLKDEGLDSGGPGEAEPRVSAMYRVGRQAAQDQEDAESDRLLYVAATRAKELLLINGTVGRGLAGWLKRLDQALSLSDHLSEVKDPGDAATIRLTIEAGGQEVACTWYHAGAELPSTPIVPASEERVPLPAVLPLLRSLAPESLVVDEEAVEAERDPPRRVWRVVPERGREAAPAWVVGKVVHGALEQWAFPSSGDSHFEKWAAAEARGCGIADEREIRDGVRRAARILARFQATPLYGQMQAAPQRYHEVPYSAIDEQGRLEHGVIDALFREEGGWVLVEFKTDRIRDQQELEKKLREKDYIPQVARYVAAVERLLGVCPRPVLCLLNCFRTVRLVEDRW